MRDKLTSPAFILSVIGLTITLLTISLGFAMRTDSRVAALEAQMSIVLKHLESNPLTLK